MSLFDVLMQIIIKWRQVSHRGTASTSARSLGWGRCARSRRAGRTARAQLAPGAAPRPSAPPANWRPTPGQRPPPPPLPPHSGPTLCSGRPNHPPSPSVCHERTRFLLNGRDDTVKQYCSNSIMDHIFEATK